MSLSVIWFFWTYQSHLTAAVSQYNGKFHSTLKNHLRPKSELKWRCVWKNVSLKCQTNIASLWKNGGRSWDSWSAEAWMDRCTNLFEVQSLTGQNSNKDMLPWVCKVEFKCLPQTRDACLSFLRGRRAWTFTLCFEWVCVLSLINTKTCFRVRISVHTGLLGLNVFMCECVAVTQTVGFLGLRHKKRKFDRVSWETSLGLALTEWPFPLPHWKTSKNTPNHPLSEAYIHIEVLTMLLVQVITVKNWQI